MGCTQSDFDIKSSHKHKDKHDDKHGKHDKHGDAHGAVHVIKITLFLCKMNRFQVDMRQLQYQEDMLMSMEVFNFQYNLTIHILRPCPS